MGRKCKFSKEIKIQASKDYLSGEKSVIQIVDELSVTETTVRRWVSAYKTNGESTLDFKPNNKSYSKEFKLKVIKEYLAGKGSLHDLSLKYNIPSSSTISTWIMMYNNGKEIKNYDPKGEVYTMKARQITFEERLEIVKFVLENNKNYKQAAEKYHLPYSLVHQWSQKYLSHGEEGLKYQKKGPKTKDYYPEDLSEQDKLIRENEILKRQIEHLKLENEVLKKKEQLERQKALQRSGRKKHT
jgi:transposase